MPIPESERVIYRTNPLEEVVCQLRFPTILKIDQGSPAEFQELLRKDYPIYRLQQFQQLAMPPGMQGTTPPFMSAILIHEFADKEENWVVSLSKDYVALSAHKYERWEFFEERLNSVIGHLSSIYKPAFIGRVGLRYRDVIKRSELKLDGNVPWRDLLAVHIVSELGSADILEDEIVGTMGQALIKLPEKAGLLNIQHGLAINQDTKEICYIIDGDFFLEEKTEVENAKEKLRFFNRQAGCLFRWCITEKLHQAMEPRTP